MGTSRRYCHSRTRRNIKSRGQGDETYFLLQRSSYCDEFCCSVIKNTQHLNFGQGMYVIFKKITRKSTIVTKHSNRYRQDVSSFLGSRCEVGTCIENTRSCSLCYTHDHANETSSQDSACRAFDRNEMLGKELTCEILCQSRRQDLEMCGCG